MYKNARFLAVIPARGGSKGLPRKNIRLLNGKPLLLYTVQQSLAVPYIDCTVVSSDDDEILRIAKKGGAVTLKRPAAFATDRARTEDALIHAVEYLRSEGQEFDFLLTLEPTHPLRKPSTIKNAIEILMKGGFDSLLTLTEDRTDFWIQKNNKFRRLFPKAPRRRQDREPLYKENSLVYITSVKSLERRRFVIGKKPAVLITSEEESLDIHTASDLELAHLWMKRA